MKKIKMQDGNFEITESRNRNMTKSEAERVLTGDLKSVKHSAAAKLLNLSYGQIYSVRYGDTFKKLPRS